MMTYGTTSETGGMVRIHEIALGLPGQALGDPMAHIFGTLSTSPDAAADWFTQPPNGVDRQTYWFGHRDWPWDGSTGITAAADAAINTHPGDESATELASRFVNQFGGHLDDLRTGITQPRVTIIDVNGNLTDASRLPLSPEAQRNIAEALHDYAHWIPPDTTNLNRLNNPNLFSPGADIPDSAYRSGYAIPSSDNPRSYSPYFEATAIDRLVGESMNDPVAQTLWGVAFLDDAEHTHESDPNAGWDAIEGHYQRQVGYSVNANEHINEEVAAAADVTTRENINIIADVVGAPIKKGARKVPGVGWIVSGAAGYVLDEATGAVVDYYADDYQGVVDQFDNSDIGSNQNISAIHDAFSKQMPIPPGDPYWSQELTPSESAYGNGAIRANNDLPVPTR